MVIIAIFLITVLLIVIGAYRVTLRPEYQAYKAKLDRFGDARIRRRTARCYYLSDTQFNNAVAHDMKLDSGEFREYCMACWDENRGRVKLSDAELGRMRNRGKQILNVTRAALGRKSGNGG